MFCIKVSCTKYGAEACINIFCNSGTLVAALAVLCSFRVIEVVTALNHEALACWIDTDTGDFGLSVAGHTTATGYGRKVEDKTQRGCYADMW